MQISDEMLKEIRESGYDQELVFTQIKKLKIKYFLPGGVVEWFKALVLKTSVSARAPWVRIPPPPL